MKAVMYGAGNIGRGFIGALFSLSGYDVTFIDVVEPVVDKLNSDHCYPVRIVSNSGHEDISITNVSAVNGNDAEAVAAAIAGADIMATAVGVNVLKFIVPCIAAGISKRLAENPRPLNIIICENLMDANKVVEQMLLEKLDPALHADFHRYVGLVEASIGRMVPIQRPEMQAGEPLRVCVERYGFLPVDKDAFVGDIPEIKSMVPFSPFDFYIKRKLYLHNMSHATCAYLGMYSGNEFIYQAIDDPQIRVIVQGAMQESAIALSSKYGVPIQDVIDHANDLLMRFENAALGDTCARVGNDPRRKLSPADRMIGSSTLSIEQGGLPAYICIGAAAAVYRFIEQDDSLEQCCASAEKVLEEISQLKKESRLAGFILPLYELFSQGKPLVEIRKAADSMRATVKGAVV